MDKEILISNTSRSTKERDVLTSCDITLALKVAYDGAPFCGFARQPGRLTVQGELEDALRLLFKRDIQTTCAGRTDSGVHAIGQYVSFDVAQHELQGRKKSNLLRSLNALCADGMIIKDIQEKPLGFSARFDARARIYRYFLSTSAFEPLFMKDFSWHVGSLDLDAMRSASEYLIGEHDFKSFCVAKSAIDKPTCRYIDSIDIEDIPSLDEGMISVRITGNAFLHSMVRTIVGSLVAVGKDKRKPIWVKEALEAKDRKAAGECAPAKGLVFWDVIY